MPIEIREIHVRVNIEEPTPENSREVMGEDNNPHFDRETLIAACVDRVLEILRQERQR